jgi:hypothetical protein
MPGRGVHPEGPPPVERTFSLPSHQLGTREWQTAGDSQELCLGHNPIEPMVFFGEAGSQSGQAGASSPDASR